MSQINPENIDGQYPIPGRDNDSQGFRDNFTNIRTNFQRAKTEISQLQQQAVLRSALPGTVLDNNMGGQAIRNVRLQNASVPVVADLPRSGEIVLDVASGSYFVIGTTAGGTTGNISIGFADSFFPGAAAIRLRITVDSTDHTLTLPNSVQYGVSGVRGYNAGIITFPAVGTYEYEFVTADQGVSFSIVDLFK